MGMVSDLLRAVRDRRKSTTPVRDERRRPGMKDADKRLGDSLDRLHEAVTPGEREVANDVQQTVRFSTFREICRHQVNAGQHRLCRHQSHDAANTGVAKCTEELCPIMRGSAA